MNTRKIIIIGLIVFGMVVILAMSYFLEKRAPDAMNDLPAAEVGSQDKEAIPAGLSEAELQERMVGIIARKDLAGCDRIEHDIYHKACVNNIALKLAEEKQDISYCQKIDGELVPKAECERIVIFAKSVKNENVNVCDETQDAGLQAECKNDYYIQLALKKDDIGVCQQIKEAEESVACHDNFLVTKNFPDNKADFDCSTLADQNAVEDCNKLKPLDFPLKNDPMLFTGPCMGLKTKLFLPFCL